MLDRFKSHLNEFSAFEIVRRTSAGEFTAEEVAKDCLKRIVEREDTLKAWSYIDPEYVLAQARERDKSHVKGALHGVPMGIKDIIDTHDMPTGMGSEIYTRHQSSCDAACVAIVRAAGAIIMGKTVTAEFAGSTPGATTNPHNPKHTPGGSSSGSAAAVADHMVPLAFGTQTGGSVHRPSSFCGIIGYKPTFGTFNRAGIKFAAESLDTIGLHARTIDDIKLFKAVLLRQRQPQDIKADLPLRVGLCRTVHWDVALPETVMAIEKTASRLADAGAEIVDVMLPREFSGLTEAWEAINNYERLQALSYEWENHRQQISERLRAALQKGVEMPYIDYVEAQRLGAVCRTQLDDVFGGLNFLLTPCVLGEAPAGLESTGDLRFQGFWTLLHLPSLSLPTHSGPNGLPVSIQLIGRMHKDDRLLHMAGWVMDQLGGAE
jgi:Asp-tRNA(Asn)/Glu-tRNA(Gln) amidotransferase A subunit family amidase